MANGQISLNILVCNTCAIKYIATNILLSECEQ
jgi:hypothetical protein